MSPNPDSGAALASPSLEELLRNNPELSRTDLEALQDWMSKQPHLPTITDDELVPFLHSNYYSLENAKRNVENYFTMRTHAVDFFHNRDPLCPEVRTQLDLVLMSGLSKKDSRGYQVIAAHFRTTDPTDYSYENTHKAGFMLVDQMIRKDPTCPGYVFLFDTAGFSMGHLRKITMTAMKIASTYVQEGMPIRMKAFHMLNVTPIIDTVFTLFKPFLKGEMLSLLHFHSGAMEEFYKEFPKDMLPKELGGELNSMEEMQAHTLKTLEVNRNWFLEKDKLLVDESRRPGKARRAGDVFGVEGSFKKLDID